MVLYRLVNSIPNTGSWIFILVLASGRRPRYENLLCLQWSVQTKPVARMAGLNHGSGM